MMLNIPKANKYVVLTHFILPSINSVLFYSCMYNINVQIDGHNFGRHSPFTQGNEPIAQVPEMAYMTLFLAR